MKTKENLSADELEKVKSGSILEEGTSLQSSVLKEAMVLEGSVRNTGIHAAGIIIAPTDLTDIIPVSTSKRNRPIDYAVRGKIIEDAGVIKWTFRP